MTAATVEQLARTRAAFARLRVVVQGLQAEREARREIPAAYRARRGRDRRRADYLQEMNEALKTGDIEKVLTVFRKWRGAFPQDINSLWA
ncbi:MAG: hypothetical protein KBA61_02915 [Spirochaetes bacterium]|nr:hypothetical protein [Spirochaetota bacterium]